MCQGFFNFAGFAHWATRRATAGSYRLVWTTWGFFTSAEAWTHMQFPRTLHQVQTSSARRYYDCLQFLCWVSIRLRTSPRWFLQHKQLIRIKLGQRKIECSWPLRYVGRYVNLSRTDFSGWYVKRRPFSIKFGSWNASRHRKVSEGKHDT